MKVIKSDSYNQQPVTKDSKPKSYFDVGHEWYEDDMRQVKKCAYIWLITTDGKFFCQIEGEGNEHHGHLQEANGLHQGVSWKGRVDVCKKQASTVCGFPCKRGFGSMEQDLCQGLKKMAIEKIHEQFGRDITIHNY